MTHARKLLPVQSYDCFVSDNQSIVIQPLPLGESNTFTSLGSLLAHDLISGSAPTYGREEDTYRSTAKSEILSTGITFRCVISNPRLCELTNGLWCHSSTLVSFGFLQNNEHRQTLNT